MSLFASTSSFLLSSATSARTLSTSTACRAAAQRDHYAVLGVRPTASPTEIKLAFRKLAKQHHPDVAGSDADTKFKAISEAYTTLSNDRSRRDYDNIHRPSGPGGMSSNMGSSYYSAARASPGATHAWQDYRKHHPRWKAAHGNYRNPFEQHRHQQQQQKTRSDTDDLFDRMYARSQRAGNLYGTQARMRREAAQKAAWEKSHGTNVSTTLRVSQFCAAMTVVWLFVSLTRVNAEMCDPDEEEQEDR